MFLSQIRLVKVRQFDDRTIELGPGMNLIVGENGAGKTTLLRSIRDLLSAQRIADASALSFEDIQFDSKRLSIAGRIAPRQGRSPSKEVSLEVGLTGRRKWSSKPSVPVIWYGSNEATCKSFVSRRTTRKVATIESGRSDPERWLFEQQRGHRDDPNERPVFGSSREVNRLVRRALARFVPTFESFAWSFEPYAISLRWPADIRKPKGALEIKRSLELAVLRDLQEMKSKSSRWLDRPSISIDSSGFATIDDRKRRMVRPFSELMHAIDRAPADERFVSLATAEVKLSPRVRIATTTNNFLLLNQLSDGEQRLFSIIVDIARQLSLQGHASSASAVVLIDEVDVHLHPKWQRMIVPALEDLFPRCQFVATTHSPFVIQAVRESSVHHLGRELVGDFTDRGIEEIAAKVMGIEDHEVGHRYLEMLDAAKEYFRAVDGINRSSKRERLELRDKLASLSGRFARNPAYQAFLELYGPAPERGHS